MKCLNKFFSNKFNFGPYTFNNNKLLKVDIHLGRILYNNNYIVKRFSEKNNNSPNENSENESNQNKTIYPDIIKTLFENNIKIKKLPCFEVYSSQIEILHLPMDFYLATLVIK